MSAILVQSGAGISHGTRDLLSDESCFLYKHVQHSVSRKAGAHEKKIPRFSRRTGQYWRPSDPHRGHASSTCPERVGASHGHARAFGRVRATIGGSIRFGARSIAAEPHRLAHRQSY